MTEFKINPYSLIERSSINIRISEYKILGKPREKSCGRDESVISPRNLIFRVNENLSAGIQTGRMHPRVFFKGRHSADVWRCRARASRPLQASPTVVSG